MNACTDKGLKLQLNSPCVQLLVLMIGIALPHVGQTAIFAVNSATDARDVSPGDGACDTGMLTPDAAPECTLRAAVDESNALPPADIVRLPAGTYTLLGGISIVNNLAIEGEGANSTIVKRVAGSGIFRIGIRASGISATVMISKVTMTGGRGFTEEDFASGATGGAIIVNEGNFLVLESVNIIGNQAVQGGGIANFGNLALRRSTVSNNFADGRGLNAAGGGGLLNGLNDLRDNLRSAHALIENSTIGGDPCAIPASFEAGLPGEGCGNHADKQGGGITNFGTLEIRNSTISGNAYRARSSFNVGGGGITNGGVGWAGGDITLNNVTITKNQGQSTFGSGILNKGGTISLSNSLVLDNLGTGDCAGPLISLGYNWIDVVVNSTCTITGDLTTTVDPLFEGLLGPLEDNGGPTETHFIFRFQVSPINGGNPAPPGSGGIACELTDQRGFLRPGFLDAPRCDVGAYESAAEPPRCAGLLATIVGSPGDDGIFDLGSFYGTAGPDVIHGLGGHDFIRGLGGDDVVCGGVGNDVLFGNRGNDRLFGRRGSDVLFGNRGNDLLDGGTGADHCSDVLGSNTFVSCRRFESQITDEDD